ncbi:MAG: carbamoyltransferase C-terminal domain-containing protein [Methanoregula sp.]
MKILGIHIGHDSGASLLIDGKIIADVSEERFVRIKHYAGLPIRSIEYCLQAGKIKMEDIDYIALPSLEPSNTLKFLFENMPSSGTFMNKIKKIAKYNLEKMQILPSIKPPLYIKRFKLSEKTQFSKIEHHTAHAASAYFTTGSSEKQLIVTIDGGGDGYSICIYRGENGEIIPLKKFPYIASIGLFYSNVTESLGWWHGDGEGKTMGLAPYGNYENVKGLLDPFYPHFKDGELIKHHDFGQAFVYNENGSIQWHFDEAYEIKKLVEKFGPEDIAAEAQRVLEEQVMNIIFPWLEKENTRNLCCAGGVFLNVKLNQRIWYSGKVKNHHIFPNPGDGGLSLGAALYLYHQLQNHTQHQKISDLYWGPEFSNKEIENILVNRNLKFRYDENISKTCASYLADGKIVGWFQGRMESGPRALGSRSIIMSPMSAKNKDIINARVKFREGFRPFCPSMIIESRDDFLEGARNEEFMITSFDVKPSAAHEIPAVVHVDGTVRPQVLRREANPKYYDLIKFFGDITGVPVILNSSFNVRGEPIVCNPSDAIKCFYDTGLDCLAIGDFLIEK